MSNLRSYKCKTCGTTDPDTMMNNGASRKAKSICKKCHSETTANKGRDNKQKFVDYLGGKCKECGYNKCIAALEFHHLDPKQKDINFTTIRYWTWEKAKIELDKCILLCCRCHREVHWGMGLPGVVA